MIKISPPRDFRRGSAVAGAGLGALAFAGCGRDAIRSPEHGARFSTIHGLRGIRPSWPADVREAPSVRSPDSSGASRGFAAEGTIRRMRTCGSGDSAILA